MRLAQRELRQQERSLGVPRGDIRPGTDAWMLSSCACVIASSRGFLEERAKLFS